MVFLSPGFAAKHYTEIASLIRKSAAWASRLITWESSHPCHFAYIDNRLICVQVWAGKGDLPIFFYIAYAPSGARWDADKRAYAHRMLRVIEHDIAERGDIAAFLVGDLNLQVEESAVLQRWQQHGPFFDSASIANPSSAVASTCHQGKGSRVDFVFSSAAMYDASVTYQVHKLGCFPTHSLVELSFYLPEASRTRRTQRTACSLPSLAPPSEVTRLLAFDLPSEFMMPSPAIKLL